ncbi:Protein cereblon like [Actinidia chinensis var. chinensis]|uniref:Protein cereblon n=1 Tax=Actinidia chinensis var. chinensis TaxID=1590841 RepID=A0A2R6PIR4_ACTCC|nr:Protein cereblon like [Actinidia chinensis var. chinensis]
MEDESISETERHQMEQIRELESEELQIEEVDDEETNDRGYGPYGAASAPGKFNFDTGLASLHTYLGEVEETHHRLAFLDGGAILNLPLIYLEGVVLFPEATLPLRVVRHNLKAAVERALTQVDAPFTIGVVRLYRDPDNGRIQFAKIGTTAEIRQYKRLEDGSLNVVTRGQQRFRLKRWWVDVEGSPCGEVQIIQEDLPLRTPRDAVGRLAPLKNLRAPPLHNSRAKRGCVDDDDSDAISEESFKNELSLAERRLHQSAVVSSYGYDIIDAPTSSDDEKFGGDSEFQFYKSSEKGSISSLHPEGDKRSEKGDLRMGKKKLSGRQPRKGVGWKRVSLSRLQEAPRAFLPYWVYRMYDSYCLAQKAADKWKQIVGSPSMDRLVNKPDLLSFYIASKIPVSESTRQELLEIDGISYRLRREIELLEKFDCVRCKNCQTVIGKRSEMLVMSTEGPLGAYVNPNGYVHEIMTLYRANGLALIGVPDKEYSWFPGYAWTITECATCENQMGWLFTSTNRKLKPRSFWGIRCSQVADDMQ